MPALPNLSMMTEPLDSGVSKLNVVDRAVAMVTSILPAPQSISTGDFRGEMPQSLAAMDDDDLGDLLTKVGEWTAYVEFELAKADTARKQSEAQLNFTKASIRLSLKADQLSGKKLTVSDKNDLMTTHPHVVDATAKAIFDESVYQMMRAIAEKAQRNWDTISRRITQRGQQVERIKRENNVASLPAQTARHFRRPTAPQ
jgi:hypothetical protein